MKDYSIYHCGKWRDGEIHAIEDMTLIVRYDGENMAYTIKRDDYDDFVEWTAAHWAGDNWSEQGDDQETISWLEENGCHIQEFYYL